MTDKSDTPRTDAAYKRIRDMDSAYGAQPVTNLCRQLEQELAAMTARAEAAEALLEHHRWIANKHGRQKAE